MEFPIKEQTIKSEWSIVYIEGSWVIISKKRYLYFFSLKIDVLANSVDPDYAAFHMGLHCLPNTHLGMSGLQRVNLRLI